MKEKINVHIKNIDEMSKSSGRKDYINWNDYFMYIAALSAARSKDPAKQVGCCIVNSNNRIIGVGYNGFPNGCDDNEFPWTKGMNYTNNKKWYVVHAELNAILNCNNHHDLYGSTLYTTLYPCNECMKAIIQAGIKKVYYLKDDRNDDSTLASKSMAYASKVRIIKLKPDTESITINLSKI